MNDPIEPDNGIYTLFEIELQQPFKFSEYMRWLLDAYGQPGRADEGHRWNVRYSNNLGISDTNPTYLVSFPRYADGAQFALMFDLKAI